MYHSFRPGKVWYDTKGERIQAHGGSILYVGDTFYWYGENKAGITGYSTGEKEPAWHHGVRLYASHDLYNWEDKGIIMVEDDPEGDFYPVNIMDRPHILYNEKTGLYVMWAKCAGTDFNTSHFGVCISETIEGPFRFHHKVDSTPYYAGDFDLVKDGDKAYVIYEHPHTKMICQTLTDDYLSLADEVTEHIPRPFPPYTKEAPAFFERNGEKFLLTSGTTGYFPNASEVFRMDDFHSRWESVGDPCIGDYEQTSFRAQFSSVFKHPHIPDLYIALGDRWLTDLPIVYPNINERYEQIFNPAKEPLPEGFTFNDYTEANTSEANYVWLPIHFRADGVPYILWRDTWTLEDFSKTPNERVKK